jgi:tripartite-type tricarboxylate transporter receptor subunit TctC
MQAFVTRRARAAAALLAAAVAGSIAAPAAFAQAWPAKPVRVIVSFPGGTAPDIIGRVIGDKLGQAWNQPLVFENRPGAGGITAMSAFVRSPADGYTLGLIAASTVTITPHLFKDPQFDPDKDFVIAATAGISPMMFAVHPASGINTMAELIARAKAAPGKVNFASPGLFTVPHLAGEMVNRQAGVQLYSVPYNGSVQSTTAAVTGDATLVIDGIPPLAAQIRAGKLRPIAVASKAKLPGWENVPATSDTLPGFEPIGWFAVLAPTGTPQAIVERVNRDVNAAMKMPDVVARMAELGVYPNPGSVKDAQDFLAKERVLWKKVIDEVGVKPQ